VGSIFFAKTYLPPALGGHSWEAKKMKKEKTHAPEKPPLALARILPATPSQQRLEKLRADANYCRDFRCSHLNMVPDDADRWPDELRISDIEDKFVCTTCGKRGADIRPDWQSAKRMVPARKVRRATNMSNGASIGRSVISTRATL
jgi:hypothetical protein